MFGPAGAVRVAGVSLALLLVAFGSPPIFAQQAATDEFVTGKAAQAWEKWQAALEPLLARDAEKAEAAFGELLALEPTALRIALFADRTTRRTALGGALQLFEQDIQAGEQQPNAKRIGELLLAGREQLNQIDDGFFFANVGRFDVADANFKALLGSDPDPVALLEFVDRVPRRREILTQLANNDVMGESAMRLLRLLDQGETAIKGDPTRIRRNIEMLGGPPRSYENAVDRLKDSGGYAVPYLVAALRDPNQRHLTQAILRAMPQIDRAALNPLVMALGMDDQTTKLYLIDVVSQIPYWQSVPYLLELIEAESTTPEVRSAAGEALRDLQRRGVTVESRMSAADAYFHLAEGYYDDQRSLSADPRLDRADVWYWRDATLQNVEVPTVIFNEVMCMRSCWKALQLAPDHKPALALWLAANFRREAQLPEGATDGTVPAGFQAARYYAQSAGAEYCLMALARAVDDTDPAVALGVIAALRETAGPASLTTVADGRMPLAEALSFPERLVRVRAALTLAAAKPTQSFQNSQNLMAVLSEALQAHSGERAALVVDPDESAANMVAAALRTAGYSVHSANSLNAGLQTVREQTASLDVIVIGSNLPGLEEALSGMRSEFRFAATPVLIYAKPGDRDRVRDLARADHRLADIAAADEAVISRAIQRVGRAVGMQAITPEMGTSIALEAARALHGLAASNSQVFDVSAAKVALIGALQATDSVLREEAAGVLAFVCDAQAQDAIAAIATDESTAEEMRVAMFDSLATAAKQCGNQLSSGQVDRVISAAEQGDNATIREAASRALGALNLPGNRASEIIRSQYRG